MEEYEVRVLCDEGACSAVREYMESNGYKRVTRKIMLGADHFGFFESTDLDTAVTKARKIKQDLQGKVVGLKLIPPE